MDHKFRLLGYYNYTVILTYIGMIIGFIGIVSAFSGRTFTAVICLMASGFCDMFDGTIASTMERTPQEKCFGIQIDSLSDLICFGVLPAVFVYCRTSQTPGTLLICALYLLCALIRLSYFNVDEQERQKTSFGPREIYYGLPVTMAALFLPLVHGAVCLFPRIPSASCLLVLAGMGIFFLLPIPLKKPRLIGKIGVILCGMLEIGLVLLTWGSSI